MSKYYTAWGRHNKLMISKTSLEDTPLVAFTFGEIEAENEQEAEQKSKEIFAKRLENIKKKEGKMAGKIYKIGRQTKEASKVTVYEGFGNCKGCGYALDDKEAKQGICRTCQELKT